MADLRAKQKDFIKRMKDGDEYERYGVDLLLKQENFHEFFDALAEGGLFDPARNPSPRQADRPGAYWVPYWHILDYLKAAARRSGERSDFALANKVLDVVRNITAARIGDKPLSDNHNTAHAFVEILGLVPPSSVSMQDIDLIPAWLGSTFERALIGPAFTHGTLKHYIESETPEDWEKACRMLLHCTAIWWKDGAEASSREANTVIDDYSLKELVNRHASALGAKKGDTIANLFLIRVREVYSGELDKTSSWLIRPAIEDHPQNHDWDAVPNVFVEGLRDALLAWTSATPNRAKEYVDSLLTDNLQIVRRIAIHVVDERFPFWKDSLDAVLTSHLFDIGHIHEVSRLLERHFSKFTPEQRRHTITLIRELPVPQKDDPQRRLRGLQRRWLVSIRGKGDEEADRFFEELNTDQTIGAIQPHPDFNAYMETRWGPGKPHFMPQEIIEFAENSTLIKQLNDAVKSQSWDAPSISALTDAVEDAIGQKPTLFASLIPEFLDAKREYQYALINGFKKLWDLPLEESSQKLDWNETWPQLITFFEALLANDGFWSEPVPPHEDMTPTREWIPGIIADFLQAGVRNDEKVFSPDLLPRTWTLIVILLQRCVPEQEAGATDPMTTAINTPKGKAIEAMIDQALRACRLSDAKSTGHADAWEAMKPIFDAELTACKNANFEFSTLAGCYVAHFKYISPEWYEQNFGAIFPIEYPANCFAALSGLVFAPSTSYIYQSLVECGVMDWVLQQEIAEKDARERLLQRLALAFLWGTEPLDGPRFGYLFDANRDEDLGDIATFLWSVGNQELTEEQKEHIVEFWQRCVKWSELQDTKPASLLSNLSRLGCYLKTMGKREQAILLAVAPYVAIGYNVSDFVETLERLASSNPKGAAEVLGRMLQAHKPPYDFEDRLKKLLRFLASNPDTRPQALVYANELVNTWRDSVQFYKELAS